MTSTLHEHDLLIRTLPTPNPCALKFVANAPFKEEGKATFSSPAEADHLPLVRDVFAIGGVKQVHLFQNTLTVTHVGEFENDEIDEKVSAILRTRFAIHDPRFGEAVAAPKVRPAHADPRLVEIEAILDRTIRPGLQADGGDVEVMGLVDNDLQILYQGACGGCPSAMMGTLDAIQGILRNELGSDDLTVTPV